MLELHGDLLRLARSHGNARDHGDIGRVLRRDLIDPRVYRGKQKVPRLVAGCLDDLGSGGVQQLDLDPGNGSALGIEDSSVNSFGVSQGVRAKTDHADCNL